VKRDSILVQSTKVSQGRRNVLAIRFSSIVKYSEDSDRERSAQVDLMREGEMREGGRPKCKAPAYLNNKAATGNIDNLSWMASVHERSYPASSFEFYVAVTGFTVRNRSLVMRPSRFVFCTV
jgi:hypothetical protein